VLAGRCLAMDYSGFQISCHNIYETQLMAFSLESLGLCLFKTVDKMNILFRIFNKVQAVLSGEP
jgi:hypothetical protein